jgi:hypothetical protein
MEGLCRMALPRGSLSQPGALHLIRPDDEESFMRDSPDMEGTNPISPNGELILCVLGVAFTGMYLLDKSVDRSGG